MRRARRMLAAAAVAGGLAVTLGAVPAHASGPTLQNVYYDYNNCNQYGLYGLQHGLWSYYECDSLHNDGQPPFFLYTWTY